MVECADEIKKTFFFPEITLKSATGTLPGQQPTTNAAELCMSVHTLLVSFTYQAIPWTFIDISSSGPS